VWPPPPPPEHKKTSSTHRALKTFLILIIFGATCPWVAYRGSEEVWARRRGSRRGERAGGPAAANPVAAWRTPAARQPVTILAGIRPHSSGSTSLGQNLIRKQVDNALDESDWQPVQKMQQFWVRSQRPLKPKESEGRQMKQRWF
jgi:hypothetical protein